MTAYLNTCLHTDDAAPATAVLTFIHCLAAAAECVKSQDSSHTVSNETHLERSDTRGGDQKMKDFLDVNRHLQKKE